jgi:hypothetical protein
VASQGAPATRLDNRGARRSTRCWQRIGSLDMVPATRCARAIIDQSDIGRIAALLDDFNAVACPN